MAHILDLPDEIIRQIIINVCSGNQRKKQLRTLCLVCRKFYAVSVRELYRTIVIQPENLSLICQTLAENGTGNRNKALGKYVNHLVLNEDTFFSQEKMLALRDGYWLTIWPENSLEKFYSVLNACAPSLRTIDVSCHFPFANNGEILPERAQHLLETSAQTLTEFSYFPPWIYRNEKIPMPAYPRYFYLFHAWSNLTLLDLWALDFPDLSKDVNIIIQQHEPLNDQQPLPPVPLPTFKLQHLRLQDCSIPGPTLAWLTRSTIEARSLHSLSLKLIRFVPGLQAYQDQLGKFLDECSECPLIDFELALEQYDKLLHPLPSFPLLRRLELSGEPINVLPKSFPSLQHLTLRYTKNIPKSTLLSIPRYAPLLSRVDIHTSNPSNIGAINLHDWDFSITPQFKKLSTTPMQFYLYSAYPQAALSSTLVQNEQQQQDSSSYSTTVYLKDWPSNVLDDAIYRPGFKFSINNPKLANYSEEDGDDMEEDEEEEDEEEEDERDPDALYQPSTRQLRRYERDQRNDAWFLRHVANDSDGDGDI